MFVKKIKMQAFNIETGYLTMVDGIFTIKLTGEAKNRIDKVNIVMNNNNELIIQYNDYNYRINTHTYRWLYQVYTGGTKQLFPTTTYKPDQVLEEYTEMFNYSYIEKYGFLKLKKRQIDKSLIVVKEGLVRLRKPATRHAIQITTPYFIEYISAEIEGQINTYKSL